MSPIVFIDKQIEALKELQALIATCTDELADEDKNEIEEYVDTQMRICENIKKLADAKKKKLKAAKPEPAKIDKKQTAKVEKEEDVDLDDFLS